MRERKGEYARDFTVLAVADTPLAAPPEDYVLVTGTAGADTLTGKAANEQMYGLGGADRINGAAGTDWLEGGDGDDYLAGGLAADVLIGGAGADMFVIKPGWSHDVVMDFEDGVDLIDASGFGAYQSVTQVGADTVISFGGAVTLRLVGIQASTIADEDFYGLPFAPISGTAGNDVLTGTAARESIGGNDGDDLLRGEGGNDIIYGGLGADEIHGGAGVDILGGSTEAWLSLHPSYSPIAGLGDEDAIHGDEGNDTISGRYADDQLWGGDGADIVTGGEGDDLVHGDGGDDVLTGDIGADTLYGGDGDDSLGGGVGNDTLFGGEGSDLFVLSGGTDTIRDFVVGQDLLDISALGYYVSIAQSGLNTIIKLGGGGTLTLRSVQAASLTEASFVGLIGPQSGISYNVIDLTENTEGATGTAGSDRMNAFGGDDVIRGDLGDDWLDGGSGNDNLIGGAGADVLVGGAGNDEYNVDSVGDTVVETGGGIDTVFTTLLEYVLPSGVENLRAYDAIRGAYIGNSLDNTMRAGGMLNHLRGEGGDDVLIGGQSAGGPSGLCLLEGGDGDDTLKGNGDGTRLLGGAGDDVLEAGQYGAVMTGGEGVDTFSILSTYRPLTGVITDFTVGEDLIDLRPSNGYLSITQVGADTLIVLAQDLQLRLLNFSATSLTSDSFIQRVYPIVLHGGPGADTMSLTDGPRHLYGEGGADRLYGTSSNDRLDGGTGNDLLDGRGGLDELFGGAGHDELIAADTDADRLEGGTGNDVYRINPLDVVIEAAGSGVDTIHILRGDYVLPDNVENLVCGDSLAVFTANGLNNTITNEGFGSNTLLGLGGNDVIYAGAGFDTAEGGDGIDVLHGEANEDTLRGDAGNDRLYGGAGDDVIEGGDGNDIIEGGLGGDTMTGGGGSDIFRFASTDDFGVETLDRVIAWGVTDRIDLRAIDADAGIDGDQAFVVVAAFTNAAGQLRYSYDSGLDEVLVELDIDGDGAADHAFIVEGTQRPAWLL